MDDVIRRLDASGARCLLIGGQAMRLEGMPRFSMDWDFLIDDNPPNLARIAECLGDELDLPLVPRGPKGENIVQTYQTRWGVLQFHLAIPGIASFQDAWGRRERRPSDQGVLFLCLSTRDLLAAKRASGRPQDLIDAEFLAQKLATADGGR
ncbi:MAG: hypothetical protein BWK77_06110 [Verrucomicrobia bacterium A1]|nr:MAG: hypothetical protein BWK77_06110 [Verrucomicrobia bacterium A1]